MNLAEDSPVRSEEDKRAQDPFLRGVASARVRRSELVHQKRTDGRSAASEMDLVHARGEPYLTFGECEEGAPGGEGRGGEGRGEMRGGRGR